MSFCSSCGKETVAGNSFCGHCGAALDVAPATDETTELEAPAEPAKPDTPANPFARFDIWAVLRGNWVAAAITAGTVLGVALLSMGILVFGANPDVGFKDKLVMVTTGTAASVSANLVMDFDYELVIEDFGGPSGEEPSDEGSPDASPFGGGLHSNQSMGAVPLLVSILSLGAGIVVFRRLTRSYRRYGEAVGDAARAGLLYGVSLFLLAVLLRGTGGDIAEEFLGPGADGPHLDYGASRGGALFLGFFVLFAALAVASLMRRDWLGQRAAKVHDAVAAPIAGLTTFVLSLPAAGVLFWLAALVTGRRGIVDEFNDGGDFGDRAMLVIGTLGNAGLAFVGLGSGGRLGLGMSTDSDDGFFAEEGGSSLDIVNSDQHLRLSSLADETGAWGLWLAIPVMIAVVTLASVVFLRRARPAADIRLPLAVWAAGLFTFLPLLTYFASAHGSSSMDGELASDTSFWAGMPAIDSWLIALFAIAVTVVLAGRTGALDLRQLASKLQYDPSSPSALEDPPTP